MPYGELISRSFQIAWRHRYLWFLAVLSGSCAGGSSGSSFSPPVSRNRTETAAFGRYLVDHAAVFAVVGVLLIVLLIVWFVVSCIATPALIRSSAEHDAERPWGLGPAWGAGLERFGAVLGLRLLMVVYSLLWALVFGAGVAVTVVAFVGHQAALGVALIAVLLMVLVVAIGLSIWVGVGFELGLRSVVLGGLGPWKALRHGLWLTTRKPGRIALVWLIYIGLATGLGVVVAIPVTIVALVPGVVAVQSFVAGRFDDFFTLLGVSVGLGAVVAAMVGGATGSFLSTYWTLAFRRLEWP